MPRNNTTFGSSKSNTTFPKPVAAHHIMPRMSYTGPLMPRQEPITVKPPSFGQSVKEGFSLGIGMSLARNLVDGLFGNKPAAPPTVVVAPPAAPPTILGSNKAPLEQQLAYQQCLKDGGDHENCKDYMI